MRNLLNFLFRYSSWFVLLIYVVISIVMLVHDNTYRQSVWLTSANAVSSSMNEATTSVTGYFSLRKTNADLQQSNADMTNQVLNLKEEIKRLQAMLGDSVGREQARDRYAYVLATVINNDTRHACNFFTIDKGSADGVVSGMGVVDHNGVVGIVNVTGRHTARVISVLNHNQHFSAKIKGTDYIGSISWRGSDPNIAYLEELPRHVRFHIGDSVVTTGYSSSFPEGLPIGTIMGQVRGEDDNFFTLKIRLAPDFRQLSNVRVINDIYKNELDSLETFDFNETTR